MVAEGYPIYSAYGTNSGWRWFAHLLEVLPEIYAAVWKALYTVKVTRAVEKLLRFYLHYSYSCVDSFISMGGRLLATLSRSLYRADSRLRLRAHSGLLKRPAGFGIFSQFTGHYLYRESKRAIIYAQNEVIGLTGKRKPWGTRGPVTWFATALYTPR
jgi:hypothetical protein